MLMVLSSVFIFKHFRIIECLAGVKIVMYNYPYIRKFE